MKRRTYKGVSEYGITTSGALLNLSPQGSRRPLIGCLCNFKPRHRFQGIIRQMSHELYPEIEPYRTGMLPVSDVHSLYYEESGNADGKPVIVVHGGPGLTHDYLKSIDELYVKFGIPVILYDQIGNGRSTHLQEKNGDAEFWSDELFEDELENLVQKLGLVDNGYDILGHSWGGMMGSTFAARRPKGLRKLILSGAPALIDEWEKAYGEYLEEMDEDTKSAIKRGIEKEDWENEEYEAALMKFMSKHTV